MTIEDLSGPVKEMVLRLQCLELAHAPDDTPERVVARAEVYVAFALRKWPCKARTERERADD